MNEKNIGKGGITLQTNLEIKKYLDEKGISQAFIDVTHSTRITRITTTWSGVKIEIINRFA